MSTRTIVIGDIHGCYDELRSLLEKLALGAEDRVVAVGDLIVKGEKNREVLDLFMADSRFSSVLGNHDRALLRFWRGEINTLKPQQRACHEELMPELACYGEYLGAQPLMIDLGSYLVVHAGVRPGVPLEEQAVEDLTELRTLGADRTSRDGLPWYAAYTGEKRVLFGHWPSGELRRGPSAMGLDTGCVYGYYLSAFILETSELVSVKAARSYSSQ